MSELSPEIQCVEQIQEEMRAGRIYSRRELKSAGGTLITFSKVEVNYLVEYQNIIFQAKVDELEPEEVNVKVWELEEKLDLYDAILDIMEGPSNWVRLKALFGKGIEYPGFKEFTLDLGFTWVIQMFRVPNVYIYHKEYRNGLVPFVKVNS